MSHSLDSATLTGLSHLLGLLQDPQLAEGIASSDLSAWNACTEGVFKIRGTILHGSRLDPT